MKTAFRRLLAAALAFALSACMLTGGDGLVTPGGAEDFPNTVTELGKIAVGDISSSGEWEQAQNIELPPMPQISGLDSLNVTPPLSKRGGLGKVSAEGAAGYVYDSLQVDLNRVFEFVLARRVYVYLFHDTPGFQRRDTVICRYLRPVNSLGEISNNLDSIKAFPLLFLLPQQARGVIRPRDVPEWQAYRLVNLDDSGAMDFAEYITHRTEGDGSSLRKRVRIYGMDSTYARADASPEEYEILRRGPGNDTLEWTLVRDVGDTGTGYRRLWDANGRGEVHLSLVVRNPPSQPDLTRMHVSMRASLRHDATFGDSLKQLAYQDQRWLRNGRVVSFSLQGLGTPRALLYANDSARMTVDTVFALRDSMIRYTALYDLRLGSAPERMQEHALLGYKISKYWRRGPVFSVVSTFAPSAPVTMGQTGFEGLMSSVAAYANGDSVQTNGTITADSLNLIVRQVKAGAAQAYSVVLDAAGNLIRKPEALPAPADASGTARRAFLKPE